MSSAKIEDKFNSLEFARAAALEDAPKPEQVGELVSISYDEAEDSECNESLLAYYFLLAAGDSLSAVELDKTIERWFEQRWQSTLDFEVEDALAKLLRLGLAQCTDDKWVAITK